MELVPNGFTLRRVLFALLYLGFAGMGVSQLTAPSASLSAAIGGLYWLWAVMLIVGGGLGTFGALTRLWVVELTAQALLLMPFAVWAWILADTVSPTRWTAVFWCVVTALSAGIRAVDLWWLARRGRT